MDIEYTDSNWLKSGVLKYYNCDLEIGGGNDFEIQMNIKNDCMTEGSLWFVNNSEYGGIVDKITIDTEKETVSYKGRSWRGILSKKIIRPDVNKDYYSVTGDSNAVLKEIINRIKLQDLFKISDKNSGVNVNYQFERYTDAYTGLNKMLSKYNLKLNILMIDDVLRIESVPVLDLSEKYEYSDDYGMKIILENDKGGVNHLICLGKGQLAQRTVIDLYVDENGNIGDKQFYFNTDEIVEVYDYGNPPSDAELRTKGVERLETLKNKNNISATFEKLDVTVGDIVGGKNRLTGRTVKDYVTREIVKIKNGIESITYEVGDF